MNNWVSVKAKLPPNKLIVEVRCADLMGVYQMKAKYLLYKKPKGKRKGRWMHFKKLTETHGYWYAYNKQEEIEFWRYLNDPANNI